MGLESKNCNCDKASPALMMLCCCNLSHLSKDDDDSVYSMAQVSYMLFGSTGELLSGLLRRLSASVEHLRMSWVPLGASWLSPGKC